MGRESIINYIPVVDAGDMPEDVIDYCVDQEWSTHYQNDIVQLYDDGNPFAEWLKANGYVFKSKKDDHNNFDEIGILAT